MPAKVYDVNGNLVPAKRHSFGQHAEPHFHVEPLMQPKHHMHPVPVAASKHLPPNYASTAQFLPPERLHDGGRNRSRSRSRNRYHHRRHYSYYPSYYRPYVGYDHVYDNYGYYGNGYGTTAGIAALALAAAASRRRPTYYYGPPVHRYFNGGGTDPTNPMPSEDHSACPGCGGVRS